VATAIAEHYLPTQAGGELPASDVGAFVSLADKTDTVCGCFGVGLIPTGSADPYALRRSALGIINIIVERDYRLSLAGLVDRSLELLAPKLTRPAAEVKSDVLEFFRGRFVNLMADRFPADAVDAAVAAGCDDLVDAAARIGALSAFKARPDFAELAVTFKRVGNIVKEGVETPVDAALFQEGAEGILLAALSGVEQKVAAAVAQGGYVSALEEIATLRGPVDGFFDSVMVMAEDEKVRSNRLALLTRIARLFSGVADFGRIG
jgi:glycyl-tRNA synthetase beta chain